MPKKICVREQKCVYAQINTCKQIIMCVRVQIVRINIKLCTHLYICTLTNKYVRVRTFLYACKYLFAHTLIYVRVRTFLYAYPLSLFMHFGALLNFLYKSKFNIKILFKQLFILRSHQNEFSKNKND